MREPTRAASHERCQRRRRSASGSTPRGAARPGSGVGTAALGLDADGMSASAAACSGRVSVSRIVRAPAGPRHVKPSPQTTGGSVPAETRRRDRRRGEGARAAVLVLSARMRKSSPTSSGRRDHFPERETRARALKAATLVRAPLETSAAGGARTRAAPGSSTPADVTGAPPRIGCSARARSSSAVRSRPMLHIHGPFTAGLSRGVTRSIATFFAGSRARSAHSGLRCQRLTLQPRAQRGQTDGVAFRYQTRDL